ncbi:ATP-dependent DNA helicase 2 subunit 1 [Sitodiplosis mosellana]|uniref:ATP-dependent DNA helicase 2 subunit 1 n=1 Tax=Sitodiplosis mosellana TaxID=263140 RepID=UPI002443F16D|nr:ATP-dependent DNA helicase 2 subunit 1 [Sitodiplosis mosellana]
MAQSSICIESSLFSCLFVFLPLAEFHKIFFTGRFGWNIGFYNDFYWKNFYRKTIRTIKMSQWTVNDGIEDVDDDLLSSPTIGGREGTIYLIDVAIMENVEQFQLCLDCIEADLLKRILINARDLVSVVFYNTQHSPPPSATLGDDEDMSTVVPSNCAVFIPLKPLSKDLIRYFKSFSASDDFFNFGQQYGSSGGSCFSEALWLCSRLVIRCNYRLINAQIVLFTNNEIPHMPGTEEYNLAFVRADDLKENNILVDLVPLVDGDFDFEPFFKEFLCIVDDMEQEQFEYDQPMDQQFKYLNRINSANYRKSCLRHMIFELSEDLSLSCDVYSLTRNAKKPNAVKMFGENKQVVVGKRSHYANVRSQDNQEDDEVNVTHKVLTSQLYKSQQICGKEILFSPEELIAMKTIQNTGLRLLGFKPIEHLQPRWMIKHCLFMYPNDKRINGSTTLLRTLWQTCLDKGKYALCALTMRRFTPPKFVALVPQTADKSGNDGFRIVFMPVETNIGALDAIVKPMPAPTPEQVDLFEKLCKKLRFKNGYDVQLFCNPSLQSFNTNLESTVYDEEAKYVEDLTLPKLQHQDDKVAPFLDQIELEFGSEDVGPRPKAAKKDISSNDFEAAIRNGQMNAVTVDQLKDFIRSRKGNLPPRAVKKDLFEQATKLIN